MTTHDLIISRSNITVRDCVICDSKAIGVNFGAPTCAPCKAFFRRNARRKDILNLPCQFINPHSLKSENDIHLVKNCSQVRHCTSCRLRRCFFVGMKEELVRTEEEKLRYRQLIDKNRQRRDELIKSKENTRLKISRLIVSNNSLLEETDWKLLSNIVYAYDNYCIRFYREKRQEFFDYQRQISSQFISKVKHHQLMRVNNIISLRSFLSSMPLIQSLSNSDRAFLSKHNIRPLIFPNLYELEQTCFTESWQANEDDAAKEYVYGKKLYIDSMRIRNEAGSILITDPAVTRLWLLILFLSSPLHCHYEPASPSISYENRLNINQIQQLFIDLLWKYLSHRHGFIDAVKIFSNLIRIYLQMQLFTCALNEQVRTRSDLSSMHQAFSQAVRIGNEIL